MGEFVAGWAEEGDVEVKADLPLSRRREGDRDKVLMPVFKAAPPPASAGSCTPPPEATYSTISSG